MVPADEFAAGFDAFAPHQIGKAQHPPAEPMARFKQGDVAARMHQFISTGESGEASSNDDDLLGSASGSRPFSEPARAADQEPAEAAKVSFKNCRRSSAEGDSYRRARCAKKGRGICASLQGY